MSFSAADREILRDLARQVAEVAALPVMAERRALWEQHNALQPVRPLILVFPEGSWQEMLPPSVLRCTEQRARNWEWQLRSRLYYHEHLHDDTVIEAEWVVGRAIRNTGWGITRATKPATEQRGAWAFDPVIKTPADLRKIRFPEVSEDVTASAAALAEAQDLFGDLLTIRQKGIAHISFHLLSLYTGWRGLEQVLWDMADNPGWVHEALDLLTRGYEAMVRQYVALNLLSLNNDATYHSSGGNGYTRELPAPGFDAARVRPCDMWASAEAQEFAAVSPRMHEEFALQYERRLLAPFGLTGYGCCEPLDTKFAQVFTLPQLRRISISPFANVDVCAEKLKDRYIFSWKPHPSHLVGEFDEAKLRAYLGHMLDVARTHGCVLELVLKDTHTCENHPERFTRWTQLARELIDGGSAPRRAPRKGRR